MLFYLGLKTTWLAWLMRKTWNPFSKKAEYQEHHKTVGESHCAKQMEQWNLNWCRTLRNFNFYILENDNYHLKVETVKHWKCHFNCTILQFSSILALVFQNSFAQNHFARDILTLLQQSTCQKCDLCIFSQKVQVQSHKRGGIKNVVYGWGPVVLQRQAHTLLFLTL